MAVDDRRRPGREHVDARGDQVGLGAEIPAGPAAAEGRDRPGRIVAVVGADDQGKLAGGDGADGGDGVAVGRGEPCLAARACVVALNPGVEPAAVDLPGFEGDRPVPRAADGIDVRDDVIVAVVGVVLAVIHPADGLAFDEQVGPLTEAHGPASGVTGRVDPDGELVRAVVPDLELVEGDVCGVDDEGKGTRLPPARCAPQEWVRQPK